MAFAPAQPVLGRWVVVEAGNTARNALDQDPTVDLSIEIGRPLAPASVNPRHVKAIDGITGQQVPRSVSYDSLTRTVTINPHASLLAERDYAVVLRGLRDLAGAGLPALRYGFRTIG